MADHVCKINVDINVVSNFNMVIIVEVIFRAAVVGPIV